MTEPNIASNCQNMIVPNKISVESYGLTYTAEVNRGATSGDMIEACMGVLCAAGWSMPSIEGAVMDRAYDLNQREDG